MSEYALVTLVDQPELFRSPNDLLGPTWPEFMLHDQTSEIYWGKLAEYFPQYQFYLLDQASGRVRALGNCLPLSYDGTSEDLPDTGWDWALEKGCRDHEQGRKPTIMCAIQICVASSERGSGLSYHAIREMKQLAATIGPGGLIAPVRPSLKYRYPLTPIDRYIRWTRDDSLPFDPWLRVHRRVGAKLIRACPRAMLIENTVEQWAAWTDMAFPETGRYIIPGALEPVEIDCERNLGRYVEPNVWMHHPGE
jgi:hypothetical protein